MCYEEGRGNYSGPLPLLVGDIGSGRGPGGCKLLIQTPPSMTLGNWNAVAKMIWMIVSLWMCSLNVIVIVMSWGEWVGWVLWDRHSDQMYQKSQISGIALVVVFNNGHYLLNTYSVTYSVTKEPIELSWDSWKYWFQCVHICCRYTRRQTLWLLSNVKLWRGHYTARAVTWQLNPQISHFLLVLVTIWSVYAAHHHQLLVPRSPWSRWSP